MLCAIKGTHRYIKILIMLGFFLTHPLLLLYRMYLWQCLMICTCQSEMLIYYLEKLITLFSVSHNMEEYKSFILYFKKVSPPWFYMLLNQLIHSPVACHWLNIVAILRTVYISYIIILLTLPSSVLYGFNILYFRAYFQSLLCDL